MIAVAFWGLTRSTQYTAESIQKHVFGHLPPHKVFVHTFESDREYHNTRANEHAGIVKADFSALHPYLVHVDNLDDVKAKIDFAAYRTHPDPWGTGYETVNHFVLAMYSKMRVTEMIQKSGLAISFVLFVRPDVRYLADVTPLLALVRANTWVVPSFHVYNGFNDRFCIATKENYLVYGNVLPRLLAYSKKKPLHSETFYADLARAAGVRVVFAPASFVFQRVRMNGETDVRDVSLFKEAVHHVPRHAADSDHVKLHDGVFRNFLVLEPFSTGRAGDRVSFVRKPASVVRRNVGRVDVPTLLLYGVVVVPRVHRNALARIGLG